MRTVPNTDEIRKVPVVELQGIKESYRVLAVRRGIATILINPITETGANNDQV